MENKHNNSYSDNLSVNNDNALTMQTNKNDYVSTQQPYVSPVAKNEFPIIASTAFYFACNKENKICEFNLDFNLVRKCGFNVVFSEMFFYKYGNQFINEQANDAGLKITAGNEYIYNSVNKIIDYIGDYKKENWNAVTLWDFKDEPDDTEFKNLLEPYKCLCNDSLYDNFRKPMIATNLLGGDVNSSFNGLFPDKNSQDQKVIPLTQTKYVANYVNLFEEMFKPGVWSYDVYPIVENAWGVSMGVQSYRNFYGNLIFYACRSYDHWVNGKKYEGRPFWAYVESMTMKAIDSNNVLVPRLPKAKENFMRYEAFSALAFGAQGIRYWTYGDRVKNGSEIYYGALIDMNGDPTEAWYAAQKINREIHALKDVFLGCKLINFYFYKKPGQEAGLDNDDAQKFLYGGKVHVAQSEVDGSIYVHNESNFFGFSGLGIVVTLIRNEISGKYYKIFLNQDYQNATTVFFMVVSNNVYNILPDSNLAAKKLETKESLGMTIKPVRNHVPKDETLIISIPAGGYVIFEVSEDDINLNS